MRNRNNRISVRVTNKEIEHINAMASKSIFPKEKMIRLIVEGYPIQEKLSDDCMQLLSALRRLGTDLGVMLFRRTAAKETSELVFEKSYTGNSSLTNGALYCIIVPSFSTS